MEYYPSLPEEEQKALTQVIQELFEQTYLLERKYDRRTGRTKPNPSYRICEKHFAFLVQYFAVAGLTLSENRQYGIMSLYGGRQIGEKLGKLTTIYILLLKLIYDEQMTSASTALQVMTTVGEVHQKMSLFKLWDRKSLSVTELRRTLAALKRFQIIEVLDMGREPDADTRLMVYPTIHMLLTSGEIRSIIEKYGGGEEDESVSGFEENLSE